jgi:hypothetical protein
LSKAGQVVLPAVNGTIQERETPGGFKSWDGTFEIPPRAPVVVDEYDLALDDRRQGVINVLQITSGGGGMVAHFKVSGPLQ